jgi:hypothetical protein
MIPLLVGVGKAAGTGPSRAGHPARTLPGGLFDIVKPTHGSRRVYCARLAPRVPDAGNLPRA